ncbi:MAG: hypothetical protein DRI24_24440 [Deltaproteobacteria bacterium]|nr:MAG: hypothetical protein DRI24_24440 [Deltaproteobacteria bacterium]
MAGVLTLDADPLNPLEAATKSYVDSVVSLGAFWVKEVIDFRNTEPAHVEGERYLVDSAPTGAWVGHALEIAQSIGGSWTYTVGIAGMQTYVQNDGTRLGSKPWIWTDSESDWVASGGLSSHADLQNLANDDHLQYLTEARHDALAADNPHSVTAAQTGAAPLAHAHTLTDVTDSGDMAAEADTGVDGKEYVRKDNAWAVSSGGGITGFKNVLINGDFRINQRNFDGNWAGLSAVEYGYDRWRRATIATEINQEIEIGNTLIGETYTLSWDGGGVGQIVDGDTTQAISGVSPITGVITSHATHGGQAEVPNTSTNIQLERGTVATNFEIRNIQQELAMCQRFYRVTELATSGDRAGLGHFKATSVFEVVLPGVQMRIAPTVSVSNVSDWTARNVTDTYTFTSVTSASNDIGSGVYSVEFIGSGFPSGDTASLRAAANNAKIILTAEL